MANGRCTNKSRKTAQPLQRLVHNIKHLLLFLERQLQSTTVATGMDGSSRVISKRLYIVISESETWIHFPHLLSRIQPDINSTLVTRAQSLSSAQQPHCCFFHFPCISTAQPRFSWILLTRHLLSGPYLFIMYNFMPINTKYPSFLLYIESVVFLSNMPRIFFNCFSPYIR